MGFPPLAAAVETAAGVRGAAGRANPAGAWPCRRVARRIMLKPVIIIKIPIRGRNIATYQDPLSEPPESQPPESKPPESQLPESEPPQPQSPEDESEDPELQLPESQLRPNHPPPPPPPSVGPMSGEPIEHTPQMKIRAPKTSRSQPIVSDERPGITLRLSSLASEHCTQVGRKLHVWKWSEVGGQWSEKSGQPPAVSQSPISSLQSPVSRTWIRSLTYHCPLTTGH